MARSRAECSRDRGDPAAAPAASARGAAPPGCRRRAALRPAALISARMASRSASSRSGLTQTRRSVRRPATTPWPILSSPARSSRSQIASLDRPRTSKQTLIDGGHSASVELGIGRDLLGGEPRQLELALDPLVVAAVAQPPPGRPELQRVVAPAALDRAPARVELFLVGLEEVVGALVEAGAERAAAGDQQQRALQRHPHHLVRVPGEGVGELEAVERRAPRRGRAPGCRRARRRRAARRRRRGRARRAGGSGRRRRARWCRRWR